MRSSKPLPPIDVLLASFRLDADTGAIYWKERPASQFSRPNDWKRMNRLAGKRADIDMGNGYLAVCLMSVRYKAHRVAFALHNGFDPIGDIDHVNGDPSDNRPANLRIATRSQNAMNFRGPRADNAHGGRGVKKTQRGKGWAAWTMVNGKYQVVGYFVLHADAVQAAAAARKELFGEFFA